MKKTILRNILAVFLVFLVNGCRTEPIYQSANIPISPRPGATLEEVSEAIWYAGRRQGWRIEKIKPGQMRGIYKKRTHKAIVIINFDKSQFNIVYQNSENLKYDGSHIHVNYNLWIQKLEKKIQNEIGFRLP